MYKTTTEEAKNKLYSSTEIDHLLEEGKLQTFVDNYEVLEKEARLSLLKEATDRHNELLEVEKTIVEIKDLFMQIGNIIITQGQTIDNIEAHVTAAALQSNSGAYELRKAEKSQSSLRKRKLWLSVFGLLIVGLLSLTIALLV